MEYVELATLLMVGANTWLLVKLDFTMKRQIQQGVATVLNEREEQENG